MCISCRVQYEKDNLVRVTRLADKRSLVVNPDRYQHGRSAYVCKSINCINAAIKGKKLSKILKVNLQSVEKIIPELEIRNGVLVKI